MGIFRGGLFWFIEGIFACVAIIALRIWTEDKRIPMPPWKWSVVIAWVLFLSISVAYVGTSLGEGETDAAFIGAIITSVIAAVSGVVVWRLLMVR